MRCIEMGVIEQVWAVVGPINRNMRCIEMLFFDRVKCVCNEINRNMRCIEMEYITVGRQRIWD